MARVQRVRPNRHHQRRHRGLPPPGRIGQTHSLRVQKHTKLGPSDTLPLHPQTTGRNPDIMLIARSKSKSRLTSGDSVRLAQALHRKKGPTLRTAAGGGHLFMGRFMSATGQFLLATVGLFACPPGLFQLSIDKWFRLRSWGMFSGEIE
jgi:hypothetical protein